MYNKYPIIVFEGVEGSGKTYHIKNIEKYLKKYGFPWISTVEPLWTLAVFTD